MNNKELYKSTFSQIHASNEKVTEVIKMSETKKKRKLVSKKLIAIAACVACVASAGIVANAETGDEYYEYSVSDEEANNKKFMISVDDSGKATVEYDDKYSEEAIFGENTTSDSIDKTESKNPSDIVK